MARSSLALGLLLISGCGAGTVKVADSEGSADEHEQDVHHADLSLDLEALSGRATVEVTPAAGTSSISLHTKLLDIETIAVDGAPVEGLLSGGVLKIPVERDDAPVSVELSYTFEERPPTAFDGWMPTLGVSFIWPDYCGDLYPCVPDTADGLTFTLEVSGYDDALTAVYPEAIPTDAPPYMIAVAVGDYTELDLGTSEGGTHLRAWYLDGEEGYDDAAFGTAHLLDAWSFLERTYGPYAFGDEAGTVEVDWGRDSTGGMEHHPYFHVARDDFWNEETQVHEAAHGWFGDAVRLQCWEDFVLSEGTVTYMAARALEEVGGPDLWPAYVANYVTPICEGTMVNTVVLPDTCGEIDFEESDLWSLAPYMKGACFYEDVADLIGPDTLDRIISDFYKSHTNQPAEMEQMIDAILAGSDPAHADALDQLVTDWLLSYECPADYAARCQSHDG